MVAPAGVRVPRLLCARPMAAAPHLDDDGHLPLREGVVAGALEVWVEEAPPPQAAALAGAAGHLRRNVGPAGGAVVVNELSQAGILLRAGGGEAGGVGRLCGTASSAPVGGCSARTGPLVHRSPLRLPQLVGPLIS